MFADMEYRTVNDNIESMKNVFRDKMIFRPYRSKKNLEVSKWVRNQNFDRTPSKFDKVRAEDTFRPTLFRLTFEYDRLICY